MKKTNVLRIIDANFNRAREGMRVIEDILRFSDMPEFSTQLRQIRHSFTVLYLKCFGDVPAEFRDARHDIGKNNKPGPVLTEKEILRRNFFRIEESLRCIEECSMIANPASTQYWQKLRFDIYEIEQTVNSRIPDRKIPHPFIGVYLLSFSDRCPKSFISYLADKRISMIIVEPGVSDDKSVKVLKKLKKLFNEKLILTVNRFDIALASDIDGVHLEQGSLHSGIVRKFLPGKIIGMTLRKNQRIKNCDRNNINYVARENLLENQELLTNSKKNIKLYNAAILYSHQKFEKKLPNGTDGVIIKCCEAKMEEITKIEKIIQEIA